MWPKFLEISVLFDPRKKQKEEWSPYPSRTEKIAIVLIVIAILTTLFLIPKKAHSHSQWISWIPSTGCTPASPDDPAKCLTTGFRVEIQDGAQWIGTTLPATQHNFFFTNLSAKQHFWRVFQLSTSKESLPSNIISVTYVDSPVPAPPILGPRVTVETQTWRVTTPYAKFKFERGTLSGTVALGVPCDSRTTGDGYYYVLKKYITPLFGTTRPDYNVVKCSN